jgi:hypothetical protein
MDKDCGNCKYTSIPASKTPCLNCFAYKNWKPAESDPPDRFCVTCHHSLLMSTNEPCATCLAGAAERLLWEPKETEPEEANEGICCPFVNGDQLYCRQEKCGIWAVDGRTGTGMCALVMIAGKVANR